MSIRTDNAADRISHSSTLGGQPFSVMGWWYIVSNSGADQAFIDESNDLQALFCDSGLILKFPPFTGSTLSTATWYHLAVVGNTLVSGNAFVYVNGALDMSGSSGVINIDEWTFNNISSRAGNLILNARVAAIKIYQNVLLTQAEVQQEMLCFLPKRTANLFAWLPCIDPVANNNAIDYSGNGNTFTVGGTLTVEDGPPITWGSTRRKMFFPSPPVQQTTIPFWQNTQFNRLVVPIGY